MERKSKGNKLNIKREKEYPTSIFKYCHLNNNNHVENFMKNQIWLSNPLSFNDPFDCSVTYDSDIILNIIGHSMLQEFIKDFSEEEMSTYIRETIMSSNNPIKYFMSWLEEFVQSNPEAEVMLKNLNKDMQDIQEYILKDFNDKYKNKLKISSFSEDHQSLLMWGHYANNHEGFCIEYDLSSMDKNENLKKYLFPVTYSNGRFDITDFYIDNVINKMPIDKYRLIHSVLYKSEDWKYEMEWRFVISESEYSGKTVPTPKPKAIYLGSQVKEDHKVQIVKFCKENNIDIFQMKLDSKIYKVNPEQI